MLFLLPPSETKAVGGTGLTVAQVALTFGSLNPARDAVHLALQQLSKSPEAAAKALKLSTKQMGAIEANLQIQDAPTMRAMERYTGTLYDAIHRGATGIESELTEAQWRRAKESVLIQSSLFGLIPATDLIPAYRMSSGTTLPGINLRSVWADAHASVFARLNQGLLVDLRSKAYAQLAPIPADVESVWVEVVSRESDGRLRALNHFNKQAKGLLIRAVLFAERPPETVTELVMIAREAGMELYQADSQLVLVTDQIKKFQR